MTGLQPYRASGDRRPRPSSCVVATAWLSLLPPVCLGSYPVGGWSEDWSAEIRPEGCTLETQYADVKAEADPNIDPRMYITNDPFRLYFWISETTFTSANRSFSSGTLFLWVQPQVWESMAERQRDIVSVSIGDQPFELHQPIAAPSSRFFYLAGSAATSVYDDLIADRGVELVLRGEQGGVFRRKIPLANRQKGRFRTLSRMLEACYEDRKPQGVSQ